MEDIEDGRSAVQEFYSGVNVFITGGTGFVGKALMEKLLRSCPEIKNMYLLIRNKKGKDVESRLEELFDDHVFDTLKQKSPKFRHKVIAVSGDCSLPELGLKPSDRRLLADEINIVFHGAATVRFDEKLRFAFNINFMGTKGILDLAHEMTNLKAIIHVSTAYCNTHLNKIEEKFYSYEMSHKKLSVMMNCVSDKVLDKITPILLDELPNTYAFTKAVAEDLVHDEGIGLPIGLFRPAIVISSCDEPVPGWIDNIYGPTGISVGAGVGLIRSLHCDAKMIANIVPVDMTVNALITSAWDVGNRPRCQNGDDIPIFNYVSSVQNPLTWGEYMEKGSRHAMKVPTTKAVWCYSFKLNKCHFLHSLYVLFLHFLPAFIVDGFAIALGKKPKIVKIYKKINKFVDVISYYSTRNWTFTNNNVQLLWNKLKEGDKELFNFNMDEINWEDYFYGYVRGIRIFLLKDDLSTVQQGRRMYVRFYWMHIIVKYVTIIIAARFLWLIGNMFINNLT